MADEGEKSSARSAIILAAVVILVAAYCAMFGLQTLVWINAKHWASGNPWLLEVPQPLPPPSSQPIAASKGAALKAFTYEFTVPWHGNAKMTPTLTNVEFKFDSGQVVVFYDPEGQVDTLGELRRANPNEYQRIQDIFAGTSLHTNYDLYRSVYSASPAQVSPFMSLNDATRLNVLLLWKLSYGFDGGPGIWSFDFGDKRGFQFGDTLSELPVTLRVFDDRNHQFRFVFLVVSGSNAKISQDEIDAVVQSLQPIPLEER
jgi:hypothetical protein